MYKLNDLINNSLEYKKLFKNKKVNDIDNVFLKLQMIYSKLKTLDQLIEKDSISLNTLKNSLKKNILDLNNAEKKIKITEFKQNSDNLRNQIKNLQKNKEKQVKECNNIIAALPNVSHETLNLTNIEPTLPNVSHETLNTSNSNKVIYTSSINNLRCQNYINTIKELNLVDILETSNMYGRRYVRYIGQGAKLYNALKNYFIEHNVKHSFKQVIVPEVVKAKMLFGTGQLPKFKEDLFQLNNEAFLSPTSEVQLTNSFAGNIINHKALPIYLTAFSNCFRQEVGAASTNTQGIFRLHQFGKVEIVAIVEPNKWRETFIQMEKTIEQLLIDLCFSYRKVKLGYNDLGFSSILTYDFEVWFPHRKEFVEVSSLSLCSDFQTKRMLTRYKIEGQTIYPFTLNGSSLAIDRIFAALIENFYDPVAQTLNIPKKLHKYLSFTKIVKK